MEEKQLIDNWPANKWIIKNMLIVKIVFLCLVFVTIFLNYWWNFKTIWWFGLWNEKKNEQLSIDVVNYSKTSNTSAKLVLLNIKLWKSYIWNIELIAKSIQVYKNSLTSLKKDILSLMKDSNNKKSLLKMHILELENNISKLSDVIASLNELSQEERNLYNNYYNEKALWDSMFMEGINQNNMELTSYGLEQSYTNWPLYIKHRIIANASEKLYKKLSILKDLLEEKHMILSNNEDFIISNFDALDENIAIQILELKNKLKKFNIWD